MAQPVLAHENALYKPEIEQGSTLKIVIPKDDYVGVSGDFDGRPIMFSEVERLPQHDEPISRAEFLDLLFEYADPGEKLYGKRDFTDVPPDHKYYETVMTAAERGIVHGFPYGNFSPYKTITRGQAAKILVRTIKPEETVTIDFPDVGFDHDFYADIQKAVAAGYFKGYPDGLMRPDREINFLEAEIIIARATNQESVQFGKRNYFEGYAAAHRLSDLGTEHLKLNYKYADGSEHADPYRYVKVLNRDFDTVSFNLAEEKTKLFGEDYIDTTWDQISGAKNASPEGRLWEGKFEVPTKGEVTLDFGDKLVINGVYSGSHFGIDYAAPEGTPIYASNSGIVRLAEDTPSYGKTVIIDHGMNIFSMYLHLNSLDVKAGQRVAKLEQIGTMGSTGIATGSHLHFTIFVGDVIVDQDEWFEKEM